MCCWRRLLVQGVALLLLYLVPMASPAMTWDFDVEEDVGGWSMARGALSGGAVGGISRTRLKAEDGVLKVQVIKGPGARPSINLVSPKLYADTELFDRVRFRVKVIYPQPVLGAMVFTWVTPEGPKDISDGRFVSGVTKRVFSNEWEEIQISGFAEDEAKVWEGELIEFYLQLILSPLEVDPPVEEGPDEVWIDWITLTGPAEQAIGELQPPAAPELAGKLFGWHVFYNVGTEPRVVVAGDADRDGDVNLAVACSGEQDYIVLLLNDGEGGFPVLERCSLDSPVDIHIIQGVDVDVDGAMELACLTGGGKNLSYSLWWNDGGGKFAQRQNLGVHWPMTTGDFDRDGRMDLLTMALDARAGEILGLGVLRYEGERTFVERQMEQRSGYGPIQAGDFDGDGDMDVLWRPLDGVEMGYLLTLNDGQGNLSEGERLGITVPGVALRAVRDFDGDGDTDALVQLRWNVAGMYSTQLGLVMLRNRGDGDMAEEVLYGSELALPTTWPGIWVGDLNGDRDTDVVVPSLGDATVMVLLGQPDGSFKEDGRYPVSGGPQDIAAADFDGDRDLDLAIADNVSGGVSILFNQIRQPVTEVEREDPRGMPSTCVLGENYPNPFNTWTVIPFELAFSGRVRLRVYDLLGRKVRTLIDQDMRSGKWQVTWDGRDDEGKQVSSGMYVVRMQAGSFVHSRKIMVIR